MAVKEIVPIEDHIGEAIDRLPYKFRDKEKKYPNPLGGDNLTGWESFITAFVKPVQEFEDLCNSILNSLNLENASGVALDRIGELVGIDREGRTDEEYRNAIYIQIGALNSEGRYADISDLLDLTGVSVEQYYEPAPASFRLSLGGIDSNKLENTAELISIAKAAGVNSEAIGIPDDGSDPEFGDKGGYTFFGGVGSPAGTLQVKGGRYHLLID